MDESKEPPRSVKVVDRRKFTAEGEPREGAVPPAERLERSAAPEGGRREAPAPPPEGEARGTGQPADQWGFTAERPARREPLRQSAGEPEQPRPGPGAGAPPEAGSQLFLELVAMLARNAELLMVGAEGMPARPQEARRMIDYLGMLEAKTEGNLSTEESEVLKSLVFQLRTLFVQSRR